MGRPRIPAGEIGTIHITHLATGYRARAQARDDGGNLHQLRVVADTEEEARALLLRRASALSSSAFSGLDSRNTIAEAGAAWLEQIRARAVAGSLSFSTYESYETTLRRPVAPQCGGSPLARSPSDDATASSRRFCWRNPSPRPAGLVRCSG